MKHSEPRFTRGEDETEQEFLHRIRVNGYWKFTNALGQRYWPDDWGPRPSDGPSVIPLRHDSRPVPPPIMPYKD